MSNTSVSKALHPSKKKVVSKLSCLLIAFLFTCSLTININAQEMTSSDAAEIAYAFFWQMGFRETSSTNMHYLVNHTVSGTSINKNSPSVYPVSSPIYIVYYAFSGGSNINITNTTDCTITGLIEGINNLFVKSIRGTSETYVYFSGQADVIPIYVGNLDAMPENIRALTTNQNVQDMLTEVLTNQGNISRKFDTANTSLNRIDTYTSGSYTRLGDIRTYINDIKSYLISDNTDTNDNVDNNISATNSLNTNSNTLAVFETTQGTNLDTNLESLDIDSSTNGLLINSKFISSANWVRIQFDRLIVGSPFELVLVFTLSLGIALAMIGKVR